MKKTPVKNINDILQNSGLSKIVEKANFVNELQRKIEKKLPEPLSGLYRIVNLVDNQLIFEVPSASVKQGLRLQQSVLLAQIQQDYPQISQLEFKVNPDFKPF